MFLPVCPSFSQSFCQSVSQLVTSQSVSRYSWSVLSAHSSETARQNFIKPYGDEVHDVRMQKFSGKFDYLFFLQLCPVAIYIVTPTHIVVGDNLCKYSRYKFRAVARNQKWGCIIIGRDVWGRLRPPVGPVQSPGRGQSPPPPPPEPPGF